MSDKSSRRPLIYSEGSKLPKVPSNAPRWAIAASRRLQKRHAEDKNRCGDHDDHGDDCCDSDDQPQLRSHIEVPPNVRKVLLHSCCAPCSGAMIQEMLSSPALEKVAVFFYNPNIHPKKEYEIRKDENKRYCAQLGVEFVDADYDTENWYARTKGMEFDPERGRRCTVCFDMRMERTALYAHEHGFDSIATTNATSRWKDAEQVDASGYRAAARYEGLTYWCHDWQSDEMTLRKYQISANEQFYKQEYCGCSYSLRDTNEWRKANKIPKIQIGGNRAGIGERYFTDPVKDAEEESKEVVEEFFSQANEISMAGNDAKKRKEILAVYTDRRKCEKDDGIVNGLNNW